MRSLALLLALTLVGCETEFDQSTRPENLTGTYTLQSWGGQTLPVVLADSEDGKLEVVAGVLTVNADRTWSEDLDARQTSSSGVVSTGTFHDDGGWSYVRDYVYLLFTGTENPKFTGVVSGGTITLHLVSGQHLVYVR